MAPPAWADRCEDKIPLELSTVTVAGVKGTFLPPESANRIAFVLTECVPSYQHLIASQAKLLDLKDQMVKTASAAMGARAEQAVEERARGDHWKAAFTDEHNLRMEERAHYESMWRSPVLWLALGVAGGAALTIGIASAYKKAVQ